MSNTFDEPKCNVLVANIDTNAVHNTSVRAGDTFEVVSLNKDAFNGVIYHIGARFVVGYVSTHEEDAGAIDLLDGFCLKPPDKNGVYHAYGVPVSFKPVK